MFLSFTSSWDFPTHPKLLWHINLFQIDLFTWTPMKVPLVFQIRIYCYELYYVQHCDLFQWIMNDKRSQSSNYEQQKGHNLVVWTTLWTTLWMTRRGRNVVNDSFAHKPGGLLVENRNVSLPLTRNRWLYFRGIRHPGNISQNKRGQPHMDQSLWSLLLLGQYPEIAVGLLRRIEQWVLRRTSIKKRRSLFVVTGL